MKHTVKLAVVCLARKTYDYGAAEELYTKIRSDLQKIEAVDWCFIETLVISQEDGLAAAANLATEHVDGLICISGTFHLGHLVLMLKRELSVPVLLWGLPELPYNGGKIRLNSVCGVNLNASNLYKSGYDDYTVIIQDSVDEDWIDALRVIKAMKGAKIGIIGYRADGFFNVGVQDNLLYGQTGALVDHYELGDVYSYAVPDEAVKAREEHIRATFDVSTLSVFQIEKVSSLAAKLDAFYQANNLSALAIRCWPEFARDFGVSPCAAMSLLQSEGLILACEGDIDGALSMIAHKALGAQTPFLFDFSQVDFEQDFALFWHCGVAPCNLWDGVCNRSLDTYFAGGKGVTADFVLKSGELSVLRLDSARGGYRMFLQKAKAIPMEKLLKGTYMKVVFDRPVREVLNLVLDNGLAHHSSVVYGTYIRALELVARIKGWKVIQ
ncbi:fucose isomerase [Sphaerochaeta globosa]|uniref:L-fucose isomerase-like protein n=1 Tax=Sphaerochaeta globosa (strain ATCC BAA-1886 / DSM 22777 / Buddy) TaxID=158189 RepID=F0RSH0_SPHGB|nr:fucose isomerase [Sphaerochaeta globosa]ADY14083.1 L-fucose isomerase-like protein [Sphaerochaeta globosa str. Buddy]